MSETAVNYRTSEGETFDVLRNAQSAPSAAWSDEQNSILSDVELTCARKSITAWPGYQKTPLLELPGLTRQLNIASLHYKDEASRFGLGSFKALGGAYAVARLLQREVAGRSNEADCRLG